jgi:hypothetical protein
MVVLSPAPPRPAGFGAAQYDLIPNETRSDISNPSSGERHNSALVSDVKNSIIVGRAELAPKGAPQARQTARQNLPSRPMLERDN